MTLTLKKKETIPGQIIETIRRLKQASPDKKFDMALIGYKQAGELIYDVLLKKEERGIDSGKRKQAMFECLTEGTFKLNTPFGDVVTIISANHPDLLVIA